ncbi:MAG: hypothetical protein CVU98_05480 [Firmicutes bacterium HGW-Firmicutes-3]|jgi:diguanylate cyclase (GGDEF)-like protein|nr:MAG: hypothetical protein CVU98_05480 [Firmicutes bacterium HGW-Firmicutes-3]
MKEYIRKHPIWMVVSFICFFSLFLALAFLPFILKIPDNSPAWMIALSVSIPAILVSGMVSTPVVYFYKKIIQENYDMIDYLGKDPLTGLLNRHTFIDTYQNKIEELSVKHLSVALFMIDIDDFKHINDYYGHLTGDAVIRDAGMKIKACVREKDLICRFGGEEFMVVLWSLDFDKTNDIGLRILENIRQEMHYKNQLINYTVSIGLIYQHECHLNPEGLIHEADKLMYKAKLDGKDKMVSRLD